MSETFSQDTEEDTSQQGPSRGVQDSQFMSEALSQPGPSRGYKDSLFMNDDVSQLANFDWGSERQLPQTPQGYCSSFLTKSLEINLKYRHFASIFSERCMQQIRTEATDFTPTLEYAKHVYALICSNFVHEYCMETHPNDEEERKVMKENFEKESEIIFRK